MTSNISAPEQSQNDINPEYIKDDLFPRRTSIFTVEKLNERYNIDDNFSQRPLRDTWNYVKKYYKPTPEFFKRQLFKRIPFVDWIREYNLREWALSDIISGITIGIVHIPQGENICFMLIILVNANIFKNRSSLRSSCWSSSR